MSQRMFLTAALTMAFAFPAMAATITQTRDFTGDIGNVDRTFNFNQFDDQGGALTLQSVEILVSLQAVGGYRTVDNDDSMAASGTVEIGVKGGISSADVSLANIGAVVDASASDLLSVQADDGDIEVGGTANVSVVGLDAATFNAGTSSDSDSGFVPSAAWGLGNVGYVGSGTFSVHAAYVAFTDFVGYGGIQDAGEAPVANGSVSVVYNYVPEPASLILLGMGMLQFIRRRSWQ